MTQTFRWSPVLFACLIVSIGQFSIGLVFPSLPWIAQDFHLDAEQVQLLISLYLLGFGPSQLVYGPISDALGRKPVLIMGLGLSLVGLTVAIFWADSFSMLLVGRFIQGLGTGACAVLARASLRDSYTQEELPQALSWLAIVASFTPIIAPVFGGVINHYWGWLAVFITLLSYIFVTLILLILIFKETMTQKRAIPNVKVMLGDYLSLATSRYFLCFAGIGWLNFSLVILAISLMPFIMQTQIGMTSEEYALWALLPAFGLLSGGFICNRVRPIIGTKKMAFYSPLVHVLAGIWLIMVPLTPFAMMFGQFLMAMGNGIALPCAQSQLLAPYKRKSGAVAALSGSTQMLVSSIASISVMSAGITLAWQLGIVVVAIGFCSFLCMYLGFRTPRPQT